MTQPEGTGVQYPAITVQLTGQDGNAFNVIAQVSKGIERSGNTDAAAAWHMAARMCSSYDELLRLAQRTVHVL